MVSHFEYYQLAPSLRSDCVNGDEMVADHGHNWCADDESGAKLVGDRTVQLVYASNVARLLDNCRCRYEKYLRSQVDHIHARLDRAIGCDDTGNI